MCGLSRQVVFHGSGLSRQVSLYQFLSVLFQRVKLPITLTIFILNVTHPQKLADFFLKSTEDGLIVCRVYIKGCYGTANPFI